MPQSVKALPASDLALQERVQREQDLYDAGLDREVYDDVLSHCQYYWQQEVTRLFRETLLRGGVNDVLEIGSHGWNMLFDRSAPPPPNLHCINISEAELEDGRRKAAAKNFSIDFRKMDAHALSYPDESFDAVFGFGILHHLDYAKALDEIHRVLRPGGVMIFNEPLDINPVGVLVRLATPNARTPDEAPLKYRHISLFHERFRTSFYPQQFLSVPAGVLSRYAARTPDNALMRAAFNLDRTLSRTPGLRFWFRKTVIVGVKDR